EQALGFDAVAAVEADCAAEKRDRGLGLLVAQNLDVGQARGVIDADMHVLPADRASPDPSGVSETRHVVPAWAFAGPLARTALDASELLHVDVQELAGALALVALGRLETQPAQATHPDPREDPRHGRLRHPQHLGDLSAGHAQPPQRSDHLHPILGSAIVDALGRRRAIEQPSYALDPKTTSPLSSTTLADLGGLGRLLQRPAFLNHSASKKLPLLQSERSVTVELHPVSSLGLGGFDTSQPPRRPG